MGMDVFGKNPTSETGKYFRRNVWGWHPLWNAVEDLHPDLASKVTHGHHNNGDGLDAEDAGELAERLLRDVSTGRAAAYVDQRNAYLATLPDEKCEFCDETGSRNDEIGVQRGLNKPNGCNACHNDPAPLGYRSHWDKNYDLEVDDFREFAAFLRDSGGFEIC